MISSHSAASLSARSHDGTARASVVATSSRKALGRKARRVLRVASRRRLLQIHRRGHRHKVAAVRRWPTASRRLRPAQRHRPVQYTSFHVTLALGRHQEDCFRQEPAPNPKKIPNSKKRGGWIVPVPLIRLDLLILGSTCIKKQIIYFIT